MSKTFHNLFESLSSLFSIMPPDRDPPKRPRAMTARESQKADFNALRGDWQRVGFSLARAAKEL
jgi:hypothetical protein